MTRRFSIDDSTEDKSRTSGMDGLDRSRSGAHSNAVHELAERKQNHERFRLPASGRLCGECKKMAACYADIRRSQLDPTCSLYL